MRICYQLHGHRGAPEKVLFVMGVGSPKSTWQYQAEYFGNLPDYEVRMCACMRAHVLNPGRGHYGATINSLIARKLRVLVYTAGYSHCLCRFRAQLSNTCDR